MSKYFKLFITACLVVCMSVCLGLFATACNTDGNDDKDDTNKDTNTYFSVTVKLPDNTLVSGAEAQICTMNGTIQTCLDTIVTTGLDGVAKFDLTSPLDVTDTTVFMVKLHNLPDGYIYADAHGVEYPDGEGTEFDVTTTGYSVTITLTAETVEEVTEHTLTIGKDVITTTGHTYTFTAPKQASYKFSILGADKWFIDNERQSEEQALVNLNANESVVVTAESTNGAGLYVIYGAGSDLAPAVLTLDQANAVTVNLIKGEDRRGSEKLMWDTDGSSYCFKFTPAEDASYNVYATSSFDADELEIEIQSLTEDAESPDVAPDWDDLTLWTADLKAGVEYLITVSSQLTSSFSMSNYAILGATEGQAITITTTVEVADGGDVNPDPVNLALDTPVQAVSGTTYRFFTLGAGNFTFTVTDVADASGFYWMIGTSPVPADPENPDNRSYTVHIAERDYVEVTVNGNCTLTVTEVYVGEPLPTVEVGTEHNFSMDIEAGSWVDSYAFEFTSNQAGTYKITITSSYTGDDIICDVYPDNDSAALDADFEMITNGDVYTLDLVENTKYSASLGNGWTVYNDVDNINYTVLIEYVA